MFQAKLRRRSSIDAIARGISPQALARFVRQVGQHAATASQGRFRALRRHRFNPLLAAVCASVSHTIPDVLLHRVLPGLRTACSALSRFQRRLVSQTASYPARKCEFEQVVNDSYWHYHRHFAEYEFGNAHLGFPLTHRTNDVSRHVSALDHFLVESEFAGQPLGLDDRVAVLRAIQAKFHTDRVPLIVLGKLFHEGGQFFDAFDTLCDALQYDPFCEVTISLLVATLRRLPHDGYWRDFFDRTTSNEVEDFRHDDTNDRIIQYVNEFTSAVRAFDSITDATSADAVRMFYHRWWKSYRHADSRIGLFRAYGNSDQSRPIGALRHVIEFAALRRLARRGAGADNVLVDWHRACCEIALALEGQFAELQILLLSADYLASTGRLNEALIRGQRAFNLNSRCLLTQHVLDCVEDALERQSKGLPYHFSLLVETPRRFTGKFCKIPFDDAYIIPDGDAFLCCSAILPVPVGNIFKEQRWDDVWNSETAQVVRASILDGTYKYCNKRACPVILNDAFVRETDLRDRWRQILLEQGVRVTDTLFTDLGYDASCNLSCPQCRVELIVLDKAGAIRLDAVRNGMIDDLLSKLRNVRITSGGEALFSRHFRKVLADINRQTCPNLTHLELLTNGMLFDRKQWETFKNLHYLKIMVVFSIDACSKETFETIRRNGRWEKMLANLEFASRLRRERKILQFFISYAVQAANFREMPALVRMAERLSVDRISFFKLENIGTYSEDDYRSRNVVDPHHPLHEEFLEVVRDPALGSPIVAFHNLGPFIAAIHGHPPERPWVAEDSFWGRIYA
jgi:MoaA/NifB/PqqE/SkfB family radical SAM enzyme